MSDSENTQQTQDQEEPVIEEMIVSELEEKVNAGVEYYCVDGILDKKSKRKLFDPMNLFTPTIVQRMREAWNVSPNDLIRVTKNPDLPVNDKEGEQKFNPVFYLNYIYRQLIRLFPADGSQKREEFRQLMTLAVKLLDEINSMKDLDELKITNNQLRASKSYFDHLTNTSVLWLMTFGYLNLLRSKEIGAVQMWKSTRKEELRKIENPNRPPGDFLFYYDFADRELAPDDILPHKKRDMGLVLSGFFGALFHDVAIMESEEVKLIDPKANPELKDHGGDGNKILKQAYDVIYDDRPLMRNMIKNHHERIDGSGYPERKTEKDLHLFSNILGVVDTWDEFRHRFVRSKVIKYISLGAGRFFPGEAVNAFLHVLNPFEMGEEVRIFEEKVVDAVMHGRVTGLRNKLRPELQILEVYDKRHADKKGKTLDLAVPDNIIFSI